MVEMRTGGWLLAVLIVAHPVAVPADEAVRFAARTDDGSALDAVFAESTEPHLVKQVGFTLPAVPETRSPSAPGIRDSLPGESAESSDVVPTRAWAEADRVLLPPELASACAATEAGRGVQAFFGYDSWRGYPDGSWTNNGLHTGFNYGTRLGALSDSTGIGFQAGGSVGVYNWNGTDYHYAHQDQPTTQGFFTYGLFRRSTAESHWNTAVVQDWMFSSNYSVFAQNPILSQIRAQIGYVVGERNEFGFWTAIHTQSSTHAVGHFGDVSWRPVNQFNPYWHHKWGPGGADTWLWVGVPERSRLAGNGTLGDYLVGVLATYPFSDRLLLYSQAAYMHPSASAGPAGSREEAWQFFIGLTFYPRRDARSESITGRQWMPLSPVANNGTFFVDATKTY